MVGSSNLKASFWARKCRFRIRYLHLIMTAWKLLGRFFLLISDPRDLSNPHQQPPFPDPHVVLASCVQFCRRGGLVPSTRGLTEPHHHPFCCRLLFEGTSQWHICYELIAVAYIARSGISQFLLMAGNTIGPFISSFLWLTYFRNIWC